MRSSLATPPPPETEDFIFVGVAFPQARQMHHASLSTAPELRQRAVPSTRLPDTSCHLVRAEGLRLGLVQLRNEGVELILC